MAFPIPEILHKVTAESSQILEIHYIALSIYFGLYQVSFNVDSSTLAFGNVWIIFTIISNKLSTRFKHVNKTGGSYHNNFFKPPKILHKLLETSVLT